MSARLPLLVRLAAHAVHAVASLAPAWRRDDLRREWQAELHTWAARRAREGRLTLFAQLRLLARTAGAIPYVIWMWKHEWSLEMFMQDVVYGLRVLGRRPTFTAVAVATLAIGIGASTAIFSAVHAVVLAPLPYPEPDRLVRVYGLDTRRESPALGNLSVPDAADFARLSRTLTEFGAHNFGGYFTITGSGEAERVSRLLVTSGYFRVLGARPAAGRLFLPEEDRPSPPDIIVISDGYWRRRFGADPQIVGRTITVNGSPGTIVGVLVPEFVHPDPQIETPPEIFALIDPDPDASSRGGRWIRGLARLRPGATVEQAEADLAAVASGLAEKYPNSNAGRSVRVRALAEVVAGDLRAPLLLLQGATAAILLMVCANLANLLLAAGTGRAGEFAVRTALGASRARLFRQVLTEGLLLAIMGGLAGVALAWWASAAIARLSPVSHLHRDAIALNVPTMLAALGFSCLAGVLFALLPAVQVSRAVRTAGVRETPRHTDGAGVHRLRTALIVAEVTLSVVLLTSAGLLLRSLWELVHVEPGFRPAQVLSFQLAVPAAKHPQPAAFYDRLLERLRGLPGVASAGAVNILPFSGSYSCDGVQVVGRIVPEGSERCAEARSATPDYFTAMGIPLLRGRLFTDRDRQGARHVVVINEAMAREFFPNEDPVGQEIIYSSRRQNDAREIVGVVADVRHFGLDRAAVPEFYLPHAQPPVYGGMTVVLRAAGDLSTLAPAIGGEVRALEPDAPVYNVRTLDQLIDHSVAGAQLRTTLLAMFAGIAVLLGALGTYGVLSIAVARRWRELGVRLALGATPRDLTRLVMRQGMAPAAIGLALGLAASILVARALDSLLYNVAPYDPAAFTVGALVIAAAAVLAAWIPARRVARVDPASVLR